MSNLVFLNGSEVALSNTASSIGNARLVRIYNGNAADQLVTVKSGSTTTGTVTVKTKDVIFLRKETAETVEVGSGVAGVKAVSCKFSH